MTSSQRDDTNGRFTYSGGFERFCVCGHTLGIHTAEAPHACGNYGTGVVDCDCRKFRPTKKLMTLSPEELKLYDSSTTGSQRDEERIKQVFLNNQITDSDASEFEDIEMFDLQQVVTDLASLILLDRSQRHKEILDDLRDEAMHYQRVCRHCGYQWFGLHCPHDGYQNPCPKCTRMPAYMSRQAAANCNCELVLPASDITAQLEALKD